jgi:patatin-like phospholipase/acyl hydrolase
MSNEVKKPFRVLSLDGGGMRGLYSARVLQKLACLMDGTKECELDLGTGFDLIVGTSTGGILAAALTAGVPIEKVIHLYQKEGPQIFSDTQPPPPTGLRPPVLRGWKLIKMVQVIWWLAKHYRTVKRDPFVLWCMRNLHKAANNATELRQALERIFKEQTFKELFESRNIGLCLTAVKVTNERFCVFKTPHRPDLKRDLFLKVVDGCMATSAAPIYLPLAAISFGDSSGHLEAYADGGLAANNPVLVGLTEALSLAGDTDREIHILSLGTCSAPEGEVLQSNQLDRGLLDWKVGAKALGLSMNAQASAAQETAKLLAQWFTKHDRPVRLVRFPEATRSPAHIEHLRVMDSASAVTVQALMTFAEEDAIEAFTNSKDEGSSSGRVIKEAFAAMRKLQPTEEAK